MSIIRFLRDKKENIVFPRTVVDAIKNNEGKSLQDILDELFTSVSNGKASVASAITDKGVTTAQDATFAQMAANILQISGGGGGGGGGTTEKIFAASVTELEQIGTNQCVPAHNSVMFMPSDDGVLKVGSDNIAGDPATGKAIAVLAETISFSAIENGYEISYNPGYTGSKSFSNQRFGYSVNIENGKTYTLQFETNAAGVVYLYLAQETSDGTLMNSGTLVDRIEVSGGKRQITFTASTNADYIRIPFPTLGDPGIDTISITKLTLTEGAVPLPWGAGGESIAVTAGVPVYIGDVKDKNCVGTGVFYQSPLAVTELNGVKTKDGKINTCATNKTFVNMGDSIWAFGSSTGGIGTITEYVKELCGGEWTNISTGGSTMASRPGSYAGQYDAFDFWKLADAIVSGNFTEAKGATSGTTSNINNVDNITWSDVDCITIAFGTNDLAFGAEIDNNSNLLDKTTICGAFRYGVQAISGAYPNIRFKVLGIVYRSSDAVTPAKIVECNEALKKAAAYVGAEFVDGYGINGGNSGTFLYDGTHPNANGKKRIAETLARSVVNITFD